LNNVGGIFILRGPNVSLSNIGMPINSPDDWPFVFYGLLIL